MLFLDDFRLQKSAGLSDNSVWTRKSGLVYVYGDVAFIGSTIKIKSDQYIMPKQYSVKRHTKQLLMLL